ncbi:MAG: DNA polymerase, partial [Candidatus Thorarchaeota archaeon]
EKAKLIVVGEAPGRTEVEQQRPFIGPAGQLLDGMLRPLGLERDEVHYTNAVMCRPHDNRDPTKLEMECCSLRLEKELEDYNVPIVALGKTAMHQTGVEYSHRDYWSGNKIGGWHPAYILRQPNRAPELYNTLWKATNTRAEPVLDPTTILGDLPDPGADRLIWDLETDNVDWRNDDILCIAFTVDGQEAYILDGMELAKYGDDVARLLNHGTPNGGHNIRFDMNFLKYQMGISTHPTIDTMMMHNCLKETVGGHDLKGLSAFYFDAPDYESYLVQKYLRSRNDRYSKVPKDDLYHYAALDVCYNWRLTDVLEREVSDGGLWDLYLFHMMIQRALHKVELRGIKVDKPYLQDVIEELQAECDEHEGALQGAARTAKGDFAGTMTEDLEWAWDRVDELNPRSPKQVAAVMFDLLGLPTNTYRKSGRRSTDKNVLANLKGHPFVDTLSTYRKVHKLLTSYANNIMKRVTPEGYVHPEFKATFAETGRLRSFYHTIPRPGDPTDDLAHLRGPIRKSHIASPNNKLIVADYSQAELRIAAAISGEPFLLDVYARGADLHTEVAKEMYGDNYTKEQRVWAKMLDFSFLYGGSEYSFAHEHQLPISVARDIVRRFMASMPVLSEFRDSQFDLLRRQGYITTRMGRKRRFPLILEANRAEARKAAISAPCQCGAGDITNESLVRCVKLDMPVVLTVHDSLILDYPEQGIEFAARK